MPTSVNKPSNAAEARISLLQVLESMHHITADPKGHGVNKSDFIGVSKLLDELSTMRDGLRELTAYLEDK